MQLVQLYVQIEAAHDTVDELGKLGLIQFRDLNPHVNAFQRNFVNEVKRADEMDRKLRFFEKELNQINTEAKNDHVAPIQVAEDLGDNPAKKPSMDDLENRFDELEKQLVEMKNHNETLHRNYNQLVELRHVLEKDEVFFRQAGGDRQLDSDEAASLLAAEEGVNINPQLRFISGVIQRSSFYLFEKILFRATRGNLFMRSAEIEESIKDPHTGELTEKTVFIIFFQGERFQSKIKKICESFSANVYPCPDSVAERKGLLAQVLTRLDDLKLLLDRGWDQRSQTLTNVGQHLRYWQNRVRKEKAIYHTMNKFNYDLGRKCLIAEGWCPTYATEEVQVALRTARERSGALVPSILNIIPAKSEPPTYFRTNKLTEAFQNIVNAYGVPRYQEINPAVLTIVTFPFQFGIMFGDLGHGFLLLLMALFLVYMEKEWEKKLPTEMLDIPFSGRYVLILMSIFAMYCGALYNETFCIPMNFGSMWHLQLGPNASDTQNSTFWTEPDPSKRFVYSFGVDPVWKGATNELLYYNSLKMKMSVIIGVTQMTIGLLLKFLNGIYFKKELDVFFEFVPQILFLLSIFGYLNFMIFVKWNTDYYWQDQLNLANNVTGANVTQKTMGTAQVPMILNQLIYMFLPDPSMDCQGPNGKGEPCYIFPAQPIVNKFLVVIALTSVPVMMFVKPLVLLYRHKKKEQYAVVSHVDSDSSDDSEEEEFDFSEIMTHQVLDTIEFALGSVSHTASYLRLWALSLAHSELSTVFWEKAMEGSITAIENPAVTAVLAVVGFSVWFGATLGILLFMESLSAFLHALRLHWVEFQSKFYKGDGYAFKPFSYKAILTGGEEDS